MVAGRPEPFLLRFPQGENSLKQPLTSKERDTEEVLVEAGGQVRNGLPTDHKTAHGLRSRSFRNQTVEDNRVYV